MPQTDSPSSSTKDFIKRRRAQHFETKFEIKPDFPRVLLVEMANVCNHSCTFCAYNKMTRPARVLEPELYERILREAYELGGREVGLYSGSEPFACKHITEFVRIAKSIGYSYIYTTTNGSLPNHDRLKAVIDAGLDSIKFSLNGGDRETYKLIHGKDHFDRVLSNLEFVLEYRKTLNRPLLVAVSFVECDENRDSFPALEARLAPIVDEIDRHLAVNQSGQMPELPLDPPKTEICPNPFNRMHVSSEGFLRACCNDYQNMLALEDLAVMSVSDAWNSLQFTQFRQNHLDRKLEGTLCYNCMNGCSTPIKPIRTDLGDWGQI